MNSVKLTGLCAGLLPGTLVAMYHTVLAVKFTLKKQSVRELRVMIVFLQEKILYRGEMNSRKIDRFLLLKIFIRKWRSSVSESRNNSAFLQSAANNYFQRKNQICF